MVIGRGDLLPIMPPGEPGRGRLNITLARTAGYNYSNGHTLYCKLENLPWGGTIICFLHMKELHSSFNLSNEIDFGGVPYSGGGFSNQNMS